MICREIESPDGTRNWLLISQVEHARVSGELARCWEDGFSQEVIDAIAHHDDGWAAWEAEPRINPAFGRPYSFLEMPLDEALAIWDDSIASARTFGPLAGYLVAGHFYGLLGDSDHAEEGPAIAWLTAKRKVRTTWIDQWLRADAGHTLDRAKRAQQMLTVADSLSLWLSCDAPIGRQRESVLNQSSMKGRADALASQFRLGVAGFEFREAGASQTNDRLDWTVTVAPFPWTQSPLSLSAMSVAAPAQRYAKWADIQAAGRSVELRWRLVPEAAAGNSPL
jgi:hypothetical protein